MTSNIYLMIGIPGAGKSTYIQKYFTNKKIILSSDDIREKKFGFKYSKIIEIKTKKEIIKLTKKYINKYQNIILDTTYFNTQKNRKLLFKELKKFNVNFYAIYFEIPLKKALKRNKQREKNRIVKERIIKKLSIFLDKPNENNFKNIKIIH